MSDSFELVCCNSHKGNEHALNSKTSLFSEIHALQNNASTLSFEAGASLTAVHSRCRPSRPTGGSVLGSVALRCGWFVYCYFRSF